MERLFSAKQILDAGEEGEISSIDINHLVDILNNNYYHKIGNISGVDIFCGDVLEIVYYDMGHPLSRIKGEVIYNESRMQYGIFNGNDFMSLIFSPFDKEKNKGFKVEKIK